MSENAPRGCRWHTRLAAGLGLHVTWVPAVASAPPAAPSEPEAERMLWAELRDDGPFRRTWQRFARPPRHPAQAAMTPLPRRITTEALHAALVAAGVIRDGESIRRIVLDAKAGDAVRLYIERFGDERLLNVALTLDGIQVEVCEVAQ